MRLDDLYLVDIIEAHESMVRMLRGVGEQDFIGAEVLVAAVQMKLLIMGAALSSMTDGTRKAFQGVPVEQVRGLRNRIVHGYFSVDNRMIYEIAVVHTPQMASEATRLLAGLFPETYEQLMERSETSSVAMLTMEASE